MEPLGRSRLSGLPILPYNHEGFLGRSQIEGVRRVVGEEPPGSDAQHDGGEAFDDHDPAPAAHAGDAIHEADGVGEEATRRAGQGGADEQIGDAEGEFLLCVEERQVHGHAGKQTAFDEAEEQAAGDEGPVAVDQAGEGGDDAPRRGDEGDPTGGPELLEYQVAGKLRDWKLLISPCFDWRWAKMHTDIRHEQKAHGGLELVSYQPKVFFHSV